MTTGRRDSNLYGFANPNNIHICADPSNPPTPKSEHSWQKKTHPTLRPTHTDLVGFQNPYELLDDPLLELMHTMNAFLELLTWKQLS